MLIGSFRWSCSLSCLQVWECVVQTCTSLYSPSEHTARVVEASRDIYCS